MLSKLKKESVLKRTRLNAKHEHANTIGLTHHRTSQKYSAGTEMGEPSGFLLPDDTETDKFDTSESCAEQDTPLATSPNGVPLLTAPQPGGCLCEIPTTWGSATQNGVIALPEVLQSLLSPYVPIGQTTARPGIVAE